METVNLIIEHNGNVFTIVLPKHLAPNEDACERGDTWCINNILHKCNSDGRWYATGEKC